eukprot:snap_masked-scaffold_14-processed-gene-7.46-mRNA-1 protein AED:1.00 eAED:1.00 QI:0/0/0/0/1/1/3/0/287
MSFPAIVAPIFLTGLVLIAKSNYNAKLLEYFREQKHTYSTLKLYESNQYTETEYTTKKEIVFIWLVIALISFILEKIICQGWITGQECALEKIGIPILCAGFMFIPVLGEVVIIYTHCKEQNHVEKPWMRKFPLLAFTLGTTPCVISGTVEIVYEYEYSNKASFEDDLTLNDILNHQIGKNFFQAFLVGTACVENLIFIQHLNQLQSINEFQRLNFTKKIFNDFIREGSIAQINISGKTRIKITEKLNSENITFDIFDDAKEEVLFLLTYDSLRKFKLSAYYPQLVN